MSLTEKNAASAVPDLVSKFKKVKAVQGVPKTQNPTSKLPTAKTVKPASSPKAPVEKLEPLHSPAKTTETEPINLVKEELSAKSRFGWLTNPIRIKTASSMPDVYKLLDTMSTMIKEELGAPQNEATTQQEITTPEPAPESQEV